MNNDERIEELEKELKELKSDFDELKEFITDNIDKINTLYYDMDRGFDRLLTRLSR